MSKLIINADDCGRNHVVDQEVQKYIEAGVLSSTTVMANMEDFEGAICLYKKYSTRISFGAHLNLTQGCPLTNPAVFLKYGFCKEKDGKVVFNGMFFRWKYVNAELRQAVYKELIAQMEKIKAAGIQVSHIDSHQHIHFAPFLTPVFAEVAKKMGIEKVRRPKNFLLWNVHDIAMRGLNAYYLFQLRGLKSTNYFSSADAFIKWPEKHDALYELMCHPGHENVKYREEMNHLQDYIKYNPHESLITYNEF
jgi:predicted glycoside hydrolase/deacetylase ChbG (UPF0249 family)